MEENLFIIHASPIIRRGITDIVHEYFKFEVIQLSNNDELFPFKNISNRLIIIMLEDGEKIPTAIATKLRTNNQLFLVSVCQEAKTEQEKSYYDFSLPINADTIQIQQLIQLIKNTASKTKQTGVLLDELTHREVEVIKKIAIGLANKDIASSLNISIHTVISHRKNITEKLNIKSISGLTVYAIMNNLLDISEINPDELV